MTWQGHPPQPRIARTHRAWGPQHRSHASHEQTSHRAQGPLPRPLSTPPHVLCVSISRTILSLVGATSSPAYRSSCRSHQPRVLRPANPPPPPADLRPPLPLLCLLRLPSSPAATRHKVRSTRRSPALVLRPANPLPAPAGPRPPLPLLYPLSESSLSRNQRGGQREQGTAAAGLCGQDGRRGRPLRATRRWAAVAGHGRARTGRPVSSVRL